MALGKEDSELRSRLELAIAAGREAGAITLEYFQQGDLAVDRKSDNSPVTIADRRAEEHLRQRIAEMFPADAILGEEFSDRPGTSGCRWIVDPIDGTKSFIHGVPLYGTMVGMEMDGQSVLGVIVFPALGQYIYAAKGQGAWVARDDEGPRPARVSGRSRLADSLFLTSEVGNFEHVGRRDVFDRLQAAAWVTRTWGDCYGYYLVAIGKAELMVDPIMNVWDAAAILPIIEEAGGTFTDWQGRSTIHSGEGIATNGLILEETMTLVQNVNRQG